MNISVEANSNEVTANEIIDVLRTKYPFEFEMCVWIARHNRIQQQLVEIMAKIQSEESQTPSMP
jgi:hypothetical protein